MNSNSLYITRVLTIMILIYGLENIKASQIGPKGKNPYKARSKRDIPIHYRSSVLKWAGLGKRDDHMYDNYEIDDSAGYYNNYNGDDQVKRSDGTQWFEPGDDGEVYKSNSEIKPKMPLKWTGLGKRSASSDGEIILSSPQNKLQSRSSSALKWMGLGKRGTRTAASLKWVGLGKKSFDNDDSWERSRRSPNRRDMSTLKWAGLGKRNTDYDLENPYYPTDNQPNDKRGASSQFRWVGLGKRKFYKANQNGFIVDKKERTPSYYDGGNVRAWYNAYMYENPSHKVVATKKLNPIYQWSGLGKKK